MARPGTAQITLVLPAASYSPPAKRRRRSPSPRFWIPAGSRRPGPSTSICETWPTQNTATIADVAPTVVPGANLSISVGATFLRSSFFTDPGSDTWTGTVNFGDGTGDKVLTIDQATKRFTVGHTFTHEGTFTATVTIS